MMSYLVMECHPGYVVLLDEEGRFFKAANLRYEVGQTVYKPVLMKSAPAKRRHILGWTGSGLAAVAACFLLIFGWSYYQNYIQPYSSIYLTINPEIQMDLNRKGTVVKLTGTNEDGRTLLDGYDGKGKDKVTVVDELIDRAIDMGFLAEGGRVSFSIDSPDDALFQEYGVELRTEVTEHLDGRITVTIEIVNHKNGQVEDSSESGSPSTSPDSQQTTPGSPSDSEVTTPATEPPASTDTDYGPGNDGVTNYDDTDYGPNNDGVTDYDDTDYGPDNDGVTDDTPPAADPPATTTPGSGATDYNNGNTDYDPDNTADTDEGDSDDDDDSDDNDDDDDGGDDNNSDYDSENDD